MSKRTNDEHRRYERMRLHLVEAMTQFRAQILDITPPDKIKHMEQFLELVYRVIHNTAVEYDYVPTIESIRLEITGIANKLFEPI